MADQLSETRLFLFESCLLCFSLLVILSLETVGKHGLSIDASNALVDTTSITKPTLTYEELWRLRDEEDEREKEHDRHYQVKPVHDPIAFTKLIN